MTCFWAVFEKKNGVTFRYDTRIYLQPIEKPSKNDKCIGAVIGMNPGSAKPKNINNKELQEVILDSDKTLPTIRNIFLKAFKNSKYNMDKKYIQVLNLFYLCNRNADDAIKGIKYFKSNDCICKTENNHFGFVFYAWGLKKGLDLFKKRLIDKIKTNNHIWYEKETNNIILINPKCNDKVKHPLGLTHKIILPKLKEIMEKLKYI